MSGSYWPCTRSGWCCRPLNNSPLFSLLPAITIHPNIVEDRLVRGRRADCDAVISHQTSMITAVPAITIHPNDRGGRAHAWVRGVLSVFGLQLSRCVDGVTTVRGSRRAPGMRSASGGRTRSTLQWSVHEVRASAMYKLRKLLGASGPTPKDVHTLLGVSGPTPKDVHRLLGA